MELQHEDVVSTCGKNRGVSKGRGGFCQKYPEEPPQLNLHDDSSIGVTYTPLPRLQPGTANVQKAGNIPVTSTPDAAQPSPQASGSVKVKPATFDGTGSWLDYRAHFDAVAEINR